MRIDLPPVSCSSHLRHWSFPTVHRSIKGLNSPEASPLPTPPHFWLPVRIPNEMDFQLRMEAEFFLKAGMWSIILLEPLHGASRAFYFNYQPCLLHLLSGRCDNWQGRTMNERQQRLTPPSKSGCWQVVLWFWLNHPDSCWIGLNALNCSTNEDLLLSSGKCVLLAPFSSTIFLGGTPILDTLIQLGRLVCGGAMDESGRILLGVLPNGSSSNILSGFWSSTLPGLVSEMALMC